MKRTIRSQSDLVSLVQEWGFLPLFQNDISGFSVEEHTAPEIWFTGDVDGPWEWKGPVIQQTGCAYGKFFCKKAGFISSEWYPDFVNYRRDGYDFDARYEDGLAPHQDKIVYDILDQHDSLLSKELKRLGEFKKGGRKGFEAIITRLQMRGYVTTMDFQYQRDKYGRPYGWGVARYVTPEHYWVDAYVDRVYQITPEESKDRILSHLATLFPHSDGCQLEKMIG